MAKILLLTSEGIPEGFEQELFSYTGKFPEDICVSFITTAAYGESESPDWLNLYRKQLRSCGIRKIEDLDFNGKNQRELERVLYDKDVLYVNGGKTSYLLKQARKSGFDRIAEYLLKRGKIYVGVSAGTYVTCPTIEQATWKRDDKNKEGLTDLTALGLVPFLVSCHFEEKYRSLIEEKAKTTKYPIVAINNNQAVLVRDDKVKVIGEGEKVFFNGFKEEQWLSRKF